LNRESLTAREKAAEIARTISVKEHERKRHDFDPKMFYQNCFWNRRPDGIVINKNHQNYTILECKRSSDRNEDFLEVKKEEANEQHTIIIEVLRAAAPAWTFEQIRWQGSVVQ